MSRDQLSAIGKRIKHLRDQQRISLRELAKNAGVSAGLLSKIENFRTIPSLPVLNDIAQALKVDLAELLVVVGGEEKPPYFLIRAGSGEVEEREDSVGLLYELLASDSGGELNFRANIVYIKPNVYREPIATDARELLHVLAGPVHYGLGDQILELQTGDTLYFDGRIPHSVENRGSSTCSLFKVYFFN